MYHNFERFLWRCFWRIFDRGFGFEGFTAGVVDQSYERGCGSIYCAFYFHIPYLSWFRKKKEMSYESHAWISTGVHQYSSDRSKVCFLLAPAL